MSSHFSTSLISHFKLLSSFTLSHPLYFSFSIFFFLSFLSPLSIATSLLLLSLLALSPAATIRHKLLAESDKVSPLLSASFHGQSESESEDELFDLGNFEENKEESLIPVEFVEEKSVDSAMKEGRLEEIDGDEFEGCGAKADEIVGTRSGSKAAVGNRDNGGGGNGTGTNAEEYNLGSHGYRRKEREWKRTLACKLYEERNQSGEAMDLLWETYEMETMKNEEKQDDESKKKCEKDSEEEEEEEEMDETEKLCCLQALKLSAGKMNSGIGRPNLMKISKAIKRFGWLKSVSKKVHSRDIHLQKKVSTTR